MGKSPTILLADDHKIIHVGLSLLIEKIRPKAVIHFATDFPTVMGLVDILKFDLIIMDINMPGGNFQSTLEYVKRKQPQVKVMAFSSADERLFALRFIVQGADGFVNKMSQESELEQAIEAMLKTGSYISQEVKESIILNALNKDTPYKNPAELLSDREIEIATLLIQGDSLKLISEKLFIHVSTISTHKTRIFKKLNIQTLPELIDVLKIYVSE